MIKVAFFKHGEDFTGFELKGHSRDGNEIVCAAVSSAAYLTANNITDFFVTENANVTDSDGYMKLTVNSSDSVNSLLKGLHAHLLQMQEQYKNDIIVKITEV